MQRIAGKVGFVSSLRKFLTFSQQHDANALTEYTMLLAFMAVVAASTVSPVSGVVATAAQRGFQTITMAGQASSLHRKSAATTGVHGRANNPAPPTIRQGGSAFGLVGDVHPTNQRNSTL